MNAEALRVYRQPAGVQKWKSWLIFLPAGELMRIYAASQQGETCFRRTASVSKFLAWMTLLWTCAFLAATPAQAALTQRCNWGVGALTPTVSPFSTQVMMMPVVMDFGGPPLGTSKIAFISFENASQINRDGGGVLRIIDSKCREITMFPNPNFVAPVPLGCPINIYSHFLAPASGLAAGNLGTTPDVDIIGVLDATTSNHAQLVALNLVGGHLKVKWCSSALPSGDFIPGSTAPAIAQLDGMSSSSANLNEVIIDNKVFNANGTLRFTGFSTPGFGANNCAGTTGGAPCPRSRTAVVANVLGTGFLPQVITGRGLYQSSLNNSTSLWTGKLRWLNPIVQLNNTSPSLVYPAVAEIVASSPGPEIVVVDTMQSTVRVLSPVNGAQLAFAVLPGSGKCGGPPMIGDADGVPGPEIGVASCNFYTLFKYSGGTLTQVWSKPIYDGGGQTTSTLVNSPTGRWIYYADENNLWVFNGMNGSATSVPNTSGTAIEGPVIASLDTGSARGALIVASNDYLGGYLFPRRGVRIFDDPSIGIVHSYWSAHSYHWTNVTNSFGAVPIVEPASWLTQNTYRVQQ